MKTNIFTFGFTLMELLITIAVLAIGLSLAAPSFQETIQNNRSVNLSKDLISSINMARSEAIKRGASVSICPATNQSFNSCGNDWRQGWIIFVNPNEDNTFANNAVEPLIRVQQINISTASVETSISNAILTFTNNGFANQTTSGLVITVKASGCTGNHARQITISPAGKPLLSQTNC